MKENGTFHGVGYEKLDLVRTSTHIDRWGSDGKGSLIINAREDSGSYSRSTTHFTLNTVVQDHGSNKFSEGKFAVIGNLGETSKENIVSGVSSVDTWMLPTDGKMKIPRATLVAPDNAEIPERFNGLNLVRYPAHEDVSINYKNLSTAIEGELTKRGSPVFEAGLYGWKGKPIVSEKDQLGISNWIGSDTILPGVHSGSADARMESMISDVLKLKKYTQEDNFHVNDIKPTQQLDEAEYFFKKSLPEVHPKAQAMYEEKFNKAFEGTRVEVEKWRDKHYPRESVSKLPEGFPLPNGSSTAIPPPISSSVTPLTPSGNVPGIPPLPGTSIPPPIPTNMPVDTPLDMLGKFSEWTPSKTKLPYEQQLLRNIADLQKEVQPDHHSVDGILKEGLFGGTNNKLNVDSNGNVVLTRFASDEQHLTKNWVNVGQKELLETSLFHGGGKGLPTSGFANWSFGLSDSNKTVGNFVIPSKDFLQGIRDKNIYLGNLGEGEFVLNPNWAKDYLSSINNKKVTVDKSGSVRYEGSNSISDTPPEFHGKSSEFLPNELKSKLKALEPNLLDGYVLDAYREGAPYNKVIRMAEENSVKNFFGANRLKSFDTETTNLDVRSPDFAKRGRIWQIGLAREGIDGVEHHVNPFFIKRKDGSLEQSGGVRDFILKDQLRNSNGLFSQKMYDQGNFKGFMEDYQKGNLVNLDKSLMSTLGTLNSKDVVVLQNMNFENNVLKSSLEQGILKPETYRTIADRMQTVSVDVIGKTNFLFERPREVQHQMRQADLTFRSQFLKDSSEESWKRYTGHLDSAIGAYETAISDPSRRGAIAVELQDITKSFLAEAADSGYIEKTNATLGLNMEFLVKNILGDSEKHTALSDAQQTIELHNSMLSMRSELKNGNVSDNTKQILSRIKEDQPTEVNRQFVKSVKSVLSDFKIQKHTKIGSANSWHTPFVQLKSKANSGYRLDEALHRQSSGPSKYTEGSLSGALSNVLDRYKDHPDSINDFSRAGYIEHLLDLNKQGSNFTELHSLVEKDSLNGAKTQGNFIPSSSGAEKEFTEVLGKKVQKKTVKTAVAGIGLGLAYAAFQDNPHPVVKDNENVSQQFYDDQYLGSAFVDFRERNKHYMM